MKPISIPSLKDYVIEALRSEIFSGHLADGEELTQEAVASMLNVSRIPVREAFLQLQSEGLLERLPNRHIRVVGINASRLRQNFHILAAIESEIALQLISDGNIAVVGDAFTACKKALQQHDLKIIRDAEQAFHLSLSAALSNYTLHRLHETQYRVLCRSIIEQMTPDWQKIAALDEEIWRAVRAKNETSIRRCIYEYYTVLAQDAGEGLKL